METAITKKTVIIGIIILIYTAAFPLALHFLGAFTQPEKPDLKKLNKGFGAEYAVKTDDEKRGILSSIGFDIQAFENGGFAFSTESVRVSVFEKEPERLYCLSLEITDYKTYYVKLSIYTPEADAQAFHSFLRYERREINGKPVGFYEQDDDSLSDKSIARYRDAKAGWIYYVEPFLAFDELTYEFLSILTSN